MKIRDLKLLYHLPLVKDKLSIEITESHGWMEKSEIESLAPLRYFLRLLIIVLELRTQNQLHA